MWGTGPTVKKDIKSCRDSEILHEIVHDTTRNNSYISDFVLYHKLFQLVSRNPCYKLHFLFNSEGRGGGFPASFLLF